MIYFNFNQLNDDNPSAVKSRNGSYLERPEEGWVKTKNGFIGIGYHGNESADWNESWETSESGLGHLPSHGYG